MRWRRSPAAWRPTAPSCLWRAPHLREGCVPAAGSPAAGSRSRSTRCSRDPARQRCRPLASVRSVLLAFLLLRLDQVAEALGVVAAFGGFLRGLAGLVALGLRLALGSLLVWPLRQSRRSSCAARPSRCGSRRACPRRPSSLRPPRWPRPWPPACRAPRRRRLRRGPTRHGPARPCASARPAWRPSAAVSAACSRRWAAACSKRAAATSLSVRSMRSAPRWAMTRLRSTEPATLSAEPMARSSVTRGPEVSGSR